MQNRPPSPADDQSSALKSQVVRIQDLSIKASASSGDLASHLESTSPPPAPPPASPLVPADPSLSEHVEQGDRERGGLSVRTAVPTESSPLKRKNKRASLSPTAKKKTSLSDVVIAEGELVVAEERAQRDRDAVLRTLGSIYCMLVVKNNTSLHLETVSEHRHHLIDLEVAKMDLFHQEALKEELKFKLQFHYFEQGRPSAYTFETATSEQYRKWVTSIVGFHDHQESTNNINSSSNHSTSSTSSNVSQRAGGVQTVSQRAAAESSARRMRSIASLCDQPASPHPVVPSSLGVGSSFLYATPPKTKHLILVRHGHYINAHARGVSDSDQVLSQMGRQQAEFTGKYLEQLYVKSPTRHDITIFHSDMTRAIETAHTISKDFNHCALSATRLLREGWPGRPYLSHQPVLQVPDNKVIANSAELDRIDAERMEQAFQTFFSQSAAGDNDEDADGNEEEFSYQVVVCHANLIRFFLCRAMGIDPTGRWGHFEINHCGVTRVDVCEHRPLKIISVNETGHLPHSLITSSEDHL